MKRVLLVGLLLLAVPLQAQEEEETLFGANSDIDHGGFGAPVVRFTNVNGKLGVLAGVRGGWIVDHVLSLGVGGYYLVSNIHANAPGPQNQPWVNLYYGGFELELVVASNAPVHFSLHSLVGAGAVGTRFGLFKENQWDEERYHQHYYDDGGWGGGCSKAAAVAAAPASTSGGTSSGGPGPTDGFFVVEPGLNLDFNMTRSFRLSLGGSYRWVKGVKSPASTSKQLTGPSAMVTFRFGEF